MPSPKYNGIMKYKNVFNSRRVSIKNCVYKYIPIYNPDNLAQNAKTLIACKQNASCSFKETLLCLYFKRRHKIGQGPHPLGSVTYTSCPLYSFTSLLK